MSSYIFDSLKNPALLKTDLIVPFYSQRTKATGGYLLKVTCIRASAQPWVFPT